MIYSGRMGLSYVFQKLSINSLPSIMGLIMTNHANDCMFGVIERNGEYIVIVLHSNTKINTN